MWNIRKPQQSSVGKSRSASRPEDILKDQLKGRVATFGLFVASVYVIPEILTYLGYMESFGVMPSVRK